MIALTRHLRGHCRHRIVHHPGDNEEVVAGTVAAGTEVGDGGDVGAAGTVAVGKLVPLGYMYLHELLN